MSLFPSCSILLTAALFLFSGCGDKSLILNKPLHIYCKGDGWTNITAGAYSGRIESKCGKGFTYSISRDPQGLKGSDNGKAAEEKD